MEESTSQFKRNFYKNYHNNLITELEQFEKKRTEKLRKAIILSILFVILGIIEILLEGKFLSKPDGRLGVFLIFVGFGTYGVIKKNFENNIKRQIMASVCKCFGNFIWSTNYHWHELFTESGVIKDFSRVSVDDVFIGTYKNVNIEVVEADYTIGSGKNRRTVFKGVIIKLDINKNYKGHTILTKDKLFHTSPLRHLKHTELEDVDFEKKYDVFTDDPIEARCLLTPAFMEKVKNIRVVFHSKNMKCAFYQNNLIISIETGSKDLFSIGSLIRPVADPKQFEELLKQFVSILELIDILDLDKKVVL